MQMTAHLAASAAELDDLRSWIGLHMLCVKAHSDIAVATGCKPPGLQSRAFIASACLDTLGEFLPSSSHNMAEYQVPVQHHNKHTYI
eukprot:353839-Chlamydomonas_euryale.AAC.36